MSVEAIEEDSGNSPGHMLAGLLAGITADAFAHPLDTVRARLQVQTYGAAGNYTGTWDALSRIAVGEGPRSLYRGFAAVAFFTGPAHALYFASYEASKKRLGALGWGEDSAAVHLSSGFIAELAGAFLWTPMDVVKQKMMVSRVDVTVAPSGTDTVRRIVAEDGARGLFRGYHLGVLVYGPFAGIYFGVYERCKKELHARWAGAAGEDRGDEPPLPIVTAAGFAGGAVAAVATCPLDVIKTRYQVSEGAAKREGAMAIVKNILAKESPAVLFSGIGARVLWIAPATSITIVAYEFFKRLVEQKFSS